MKKLAIFLLAAVFTLPAVFADEKNRQGANAPTEGEVRKIDREAKKITLKHGPIKNLDMPPMTMVYQVKDPTLLDRVQAGEKVMFSAEKSGSGFIVTKIEPAK